MQSADMIAMPNTVDLSKRSAATVKLPVGDRAGPYPCSTAERRLVAQSKLRLVRQSPSMMARLTHRIHPLAPVSQLPTAPGAQPAPTHILCGKQNVHAAQLHIKPCTL